MGHDKSQFIYLKDYRPPDFHIPETCLHFDLYDDVTIVKSHLKLIRNGDHRNPLILTGEDLKLKNIYINGAKLHDDQYQINDNQLRIDNVPNEFTLEIEVEINPKENKLLMGLYKSKEIYCTQCESHGFRRITYFLDRPDTLSRFTTTITADHTCYPILLSNGNLIAKETLTNNRHQVTWQDPSLKPAYLFALVAGKFDLLEDEFVTMSGRNVQLLLYVEEGKKDQGDYAVQSLKRAMRWDEKTFDREYELDIYMIVAVSDFNFGAMENKGLNIFNDRYILANQDTATDDDFIWVESVIGHEYFHNWSGNRVTVRDWFQITLKEGLTIFREQSFRADMQLKTVSRIQDVNRIRTEQFAQDSGPMAHPIRPDHYIEVNNFYTLTVYHKGAEVIRMIQTLIGKEAFRRGMDLYFTSHDGEAVTTDDFVMAMEDASGVDLKQFRRWYKQAGTPVLDVTDDYRDGIYTLTVKQSCPQTPDQPIKKDFQIPLAIGLLGKDGMELPVQFENEEKAFEKTTRVLDIKNNSETFRFRAPQKPIPSLLRNFSAPVVINYDCSNDDLIFLLRNDTDGFNRWDAGQKLATKILLSLIEDSNKQQTLHLSNDFITAWESVLLDKHMDEGLCAEMLLLPKESFLMEQMPVVDIDSLHRVYQFLKITLAEKSKEQLLEVYHKNCYQPYELTPKAISQRRLKNICLDYLTELSDHSGISIAVKQCKNADNMTDTMGALIALNDCDCPERESALSEFYGKWQHEDLVVNKWLTLHAISDIPERLNVVKQLINHKAFNLKNPNKVYALIGAFTSRNHVQFHEKNGAAYHFLTEQVLSIDRFNPQLASRLIEPLINWKKFDGKRQKLMQAELTRIHDTKEISKNLYEIVARSVKAITS